MDTTQRTAVIVTGDPAGRAFVNLRATGHRPDRRAPEKTIEAIRAYR